MQSPLAWARRKPGCRPSWICRELTMSCGLSRSGESHPAAKAKPAVRVSRTAPIAASRRTTIGVMRFTGMLRLSRVQSCFSALSRQPMITWPSTGLLKKPTAPAASARLRTRSSGKAVMKMIGMRCRAHAARSAGRARSCPASGCRRSGTRCPAGGARRGSPRPRRTRRPRTRATAPGCSLRYGRNRRRRRWRPEAFSTRDRSSDGGRNHRRDSVKPNSRTDCPIGDAREIIRTFRVDAPSADEARGSLPCSRDRPATCALIFFMTWPR